MLDKSFSDFSTIDVDNVASWGELTGFLQLPPTFPSLDPLTAFIHEYAVYMFLDNLNTLQSNNMKKFFLNTIVPITRQGKPQLITEDLMILEKRYETVKQKLAMCENMLNERKTLLRYITDKLQSIIKTFNLFAKYVEEENTSVQN